nr:MAG TPA: hypothetical protein [Caudoviricetes sp.]
MNVNGSLASNSRIGKGSTIISLWESKLQANGS